MMTPDPPALPPWVVMQSQNPVLASVMSELFGNERFSQHMGSIFAPQGQEPYTAFVSDPSILERINAGRPRNQQLQIDPNTGAVAMMGSQRMGGVVIDPDKLHEAAGQDSAKAREMIRDALLHEFAHLVPVAQGGKPTGDPKPGDKNFAKHPAIVGENSLRGLLDLPAKTFYGLLEGR